MRLVQGAEMARVVLLGAGVLLSLGRPVHAGDGEEEGSRDRGWSIGFQLVSDHIGAESPDPESSPDAVYVSEKGAGALVSVGYAFDPAFALRLSLAGARHETTLQDVGIDHASVSLEAHHRFSRWGRAQPYLFGGLGGSTLEFNSDLLDSRTSGAVAVLGVGIVFDLTRHLSLDLATRLDLINWDKVEVISVLPGNVVVHLEDPVDEKGSAAKLLVGLLWRF